MRLPYVHALVLASCVLACGGGTPPPKGESDTVEHPSSMGDGGDKAATDSPSPTGAGQSATSPASKQNSSGDLVAPQTDDPWMAPHQMPSGDVLRVMRASTSKVNACWHAAKKRDPSVGGEVKIKFVISHEGTVRVWRNEDSTTSDEGAIQCLGELIKSLKFPTQKSPGDAWGIYQINFGG